MGAIVMNSEEKITEDSKKSPVHVKSSSLESKDLTVITDNKVNKIFSIQENHWDELQDKEILSYHLTEKEPRTVVTPQGKRCFTKEISETTVKLRIEKAIDDCTKQAILTSPLNNFDKAVLEACATHQYHGENYITVNTIFKYLGGTCDPNPTMVQKIMDSVNKMRFIDVRIDATESYKKLKRLQKPDGTPKRKPNKDGKIILSNYLLPSKKVEIEVNGVTVEGGIQFLDVSPIFQYSQDKGELATLEKKLLQARKEAINCTDKSIKLKNYILSRLNAITRSRKGGGKSLAPTITFEGLYNNCIEDPEKIKDRPTRQRTRETAEKYLQFLVSEKKIKSFTIVGKDNKPKDKLADGVKFSLVIP